MDVVELKIKNYNSRVSRKSKKSGMMIRMILNNHVNEYLIVTYSNVTRFIFNHEENYNKYDMLGRYYYDEYLMVDDDIFSHEILLESGTSFLIHFKDISCEIGKSYRTQMSKNKP